MTFKTAYIFPPIPFRGCDWIAYVDGDEETRSFGATESEAIENLRQHIEERYAATVKCGACEGIQTQLNGLWQVIEDAGGRKCNQCGGTGSIIQWRSDIPSPVNCANYGCIRGVLMPKASEPSEKLMRIVNAARAFVLDTKPRAAHDSWVIGPVTQELFDAVDASLPSVPRELQKGGVS